METQIKLRRPLGALALFGGATAATALFGRRITKPALGPRWYHRLRKPPFQPPPGVFGPVWSVLYPLIALSGWRVWRASGRGPMRRGALQLWAAQLGLNGAWSYLFFGRRMKRAALADLILLTATVGLYINRARHVDRGAAVLAAPYLGWLGFATVLNEEVVRRN